MSIFLFFFFEWNSRSPDHFFYFQSRIENFPYLYKRKTWLFFLHWQEGVVPWITTSVEPEMSQRRGGNKYVVELKRGNFGWNQVKLERGRRERVLLGIGFGMEGMREEAC